MDRLAQLGRPFRRAYAQVAMCGPSRASLLLGIRPERDGVWHNLMPPRRDGSVPIQEHFAANGYVTASIGKVYEPAFADRFTWDELPEARLESGEELEERPDRRGPDPRAGGG